MLLRHLFITSLFGNFFMDQVWKPLAPKSLLIFCSYYTDQVLGHSKGMIADRIT